MPDRQRFQQKDIHEAEDGGVCPNAQRQRQDRNCRKPRLRRQQTQAITHVLPQMPHRATSPKDKTEPIADKSLVKMRKAPGPARGDGGLLRNPERGTRSGSPAPPYMSGALRSEFR